MEFSSTDFGVTEGRSVSITCVLSLSSDRDVAVDIATSGNTAMGKSISVHRHGTGLETAHTLPLTHCINFGEPSVLSMNLVGNVGLH